MYIKAIVKDCLFLVENNQKMKYNRIHNIRKEEIKVIELLSPVGDFECLKAAVQNGADSVYFGANMFSARAFAANFGDEELEKAINYAKIRGVKTNLTLNTLIKDSEFEDAYNIAKKAYEFGVDAIIVQDMGLAMKLIKDFPDLDIHGSTQMTVHNLEGALELQKLGFKRVVLSRELSANEIENICKNVDIEVETFIHGALCMSYSGQCLFSSMIGGRSGNRGKCAQTCRLPFELYENDNMIDKGYLLSPRDLCGLEYIPFLIKAGVKCFKIEGRMKTPEYVATVTRIYRKYIDIAINLLDGQEYKIDEQDKKELLQVFNRGGFSAGHLDEIANTDLVFKEKSNNMGIFLGTIMEFNKPKGLITLKLNEDLDLGDSISIEKETGKYTISELVKNNQNVKNAKVGDVVTIGRMKGNISIKDKVYKLESKELTKKALESFENENRKTYLNIKISIKRNEKIKLEIENSLNVSIEYDYIPLNAENKPLDREKIIAQFSKTNDAPFEFRNFDIELDDGLFLPVSVLNDLRRTILSEYEIKIVSSFKRVSKFELDRLPGDGQTKENVQNKKISLLLNQLNLDFDYTKLKEVDKLYIPLEYFGSVKYEQILEQLKNNKMYVYMPTIIRKKYRDRAVDILNKACNKYDLCGIVISNISQLNLIREIRNDVHKLEIIANYTMNIYNKNTIEELRKMGISKFTVSPELNKESILDLCDNKNMELIVYSNIPVMTANYCFLGKANKCPRECSGKCSNKNKYYLKDRMGFKFRVIPNNAQTITTIYNCKTTSISPKDFNSDTVRIDILNENIDEINEIVSVVSSGSRMEGQEFTNSNMNREI